MARRIEGWKSRLLSLAGRTTLIQSVALSVPIYTMSSFLIPKSICTALDKLVRRFWWKGSDDSNRFLALANWDSICVPKRWGGLGFKKFEDLNFALVAKLGWNLAAGSNAVWCQVFKDKYFRRSSSFWSTPKSSSWSYGARSIVATREFIRDESCFMIGNGDLVDIWNSPWLPSYEWERYEASFNPRIREKGVRISSLFTPKSGGWNREALETWFLPGLVKDALEVPRLPLVAKDELFWKSAPDGLFSVKRAYLARTRDRGLLETLWSALWKVSGPERIKIFLWRLARDILPFGCRIQRIFGNSSQCVLCNSGEDSALHLFFHCDFAVQVWRSGPWGFCSDSMAFDDNLDLVKWLVNPWGTPLSGSDIAKFSTYAISLCFVMWRARNSAFHEGHTPVVPKIQHDISLMVADCSVFEPPSLEQQGQALLQVEDIWGGHWTDVNVFVDAAIRGDFGIIAILVLDRSGVMIEAATAKRKASSPFAAELEAFHWGCCRILQSGWHHASLFSDCQQVVKGLAAGFSSEWRARALFDDTLSLLNQMPSCYYHWIPPAALAVDDDRRRRKLYTRRRSKRVHTIKTLSVHRAEREGPKASSSIENGRR
uniref:Reverse transcriptase zinc-binding domain-containing protein n=1 Tax=Cannabis sativa TaxID=3483 RepID=A0A803NX31_CANSA